MRVILLLALAAAAGEPEILDVAALTRTVPSVRAPRLGPGHLRSGAWWWDDESAEEETDSDWVARVLEEALGDGTVVESLGGRLLVVPAERGADARAAIASLAADLRRTVRIRIEARLPDGTVTTSEVATRDGHWVAFGPTRLRRFHADDDVEIACSNSEAGAPSVISDPIVQEAHEGLAVDVRPFLLGDGETVALEAVVQAGRFEEPTEDLPLEATFHGRIQLPRYRGVAAAASGRVEVGEALVVRLEGPDGETTVRLVPRVEGRPGTGALRLISDTLAWTWGAPLDVEPWEEDRTWTRLAAPAVPLHGTDGCGRPETAVLAGTPEEVQAQRDEAATWVAPFARTVQLAVRLVAGEDEIGCADLSALDGRTAVARIGRDRMIVADWDVEVGCYNQIGDPIVTPVFAGGVVRLRPKLGPDGNVVVLDLVFRHADATVLPPPPSGMTRTGAIHPVRVVERSVDADLVLRDGGEARIPLGRGKDGRPMTLVVAARIVR